MHYLDDFLFAGPRNSLQCKYLMDEFDNTCQELGVPVAHDKTVGPTHILTFLGLQINTIDMLVKIPEDKLCGLKILIIDMLDKKRTTLREMQSFTGILNFCSRVIPSGRAFNRRFYDVMSGVLNPKHHIRITLSLKEDLKVWLMFLECFNGICYFPEIVGFQIISYSFSLTVQEMPLEDVQLIFIPFWTFFPWPSSWIGNEILKDITLLELLPIVLAFHIWSEHFVNKKIILQVDNKSLVHILNTKTSRSKRVMHVFRPLVLRAMIKNIQFKAVHINGVKNCIADAISRQQWQRFRRLAPNADQEPAQVPESFVQMISSLNLKSC